MGLKEFALKMAQNKVPEHSTGIQVKLYMNGAMCAHGTPLFNKGFTLDQVPLLEPLAC